MNAVCKQAVRILVTSICGFVLSISARAADSNFTLRSPDDRFEVQVHIAGRITYDVSLHGKPLMKDSSLAIKIGDRTFGESPQLKYTKKNSVDKMLEPVVRQKSAQIRERYNELRLDFDGGYAVVFRAYPEGVAYRFETSLGGENVKVFSEDSTFRFASDFSVFYPEEESMFSHNERKYLPRPLKDIPATKFATLPAVVDADGVKVAIAEFDVEEYPGLWLRGTGDNALTSTFEHYPLKEQLEKDRDFKVTEAADYIAVVRGTRTFPWRVLGIAEHDKDLVANSLVWLLEKPSQLTD